jgi:hypothetical protein
MKLKNLVFNISANHLILSNLKKFDKKLAFANAPGGHMIRPLGKFCPTHDTLSYKEALDKLNIVIGTRQKTSQKNGGSLTFLYLMSFKYYFL